MEDEYEYYIQSSCIACGKCITQCPEHCIDMKGSMAVIRQKECRHCGECKEICPVGAVAVFD